jgi:hypothetical protein
MPRSGESGSVDQSENLLEPPGDQRNGMADLILKLAKGILERNHGMMVETHGKTGDYYYSDISY